MGEDPVCLSWKSLSMLRISETAWDSGCVCSVSHVWLSAAPRTPQPTRFLCAWDFQATMMERVAIAFSRRSSWPRDPTCMSCISCIGRQVLYYSPSEEAWILVLAQPTAAGCPSLTLSFLTCRIRKSDLECLHFLSHLESENHKILGYKDFCNQITQGKAYKNQVLITKNSKKKQKNKKPQNLSWKESLYH